MILVRYIVVVFFLIGGIAHFVSMDSFIQIMPDYLKFHKELVIISGLCELLGAIGLLFLITRTLAGYGLIALSIAVFPANVNMALHPEQFANISSLLLYARLPFQVFIIWLIWIAMKSKNIKN